MWSGQQLELNQFSSSEALYLISVYEAKFDIGTCMHACMHSLPEFHPLSYNNELQLLLFFLYSLMTTLNK